MFHKFPLHVAIANALCFVMHSTGWKSMLYLLKYGKSCLNPHTKLIQIFMYVRKIILIPCKNSPAVIKDEAKNALVTDYEPQPKHMISISKTYIVLVVV